MARSRLYQKSRHGLVATRRPELSARAMLREQEQDMSMAELARHAVLEEEFEEYLFIRDCEEARMFDPLMDMLFEDEMDNMEDEFFADPLYEAFGLQSRVAA